VALTFCTYGLIKINIIGIIKINLLYFLLSTCEIDGLDYP